MSTNLTNNTELTNTTTGGGAGHVVRRVRQAALVTFAGMVLALAGMIPAGAQVRPDPSPQLPGGLQGKLNTGLGLAMGVAVFAAVLGVIIVAFLLFLAARRGSLEDHMGRLGAVMAGCVLLGGASSLVMFLI